MEQYRTEEEQVEALRRWWDENGRSTVVAIVVALALGFGWQGWTAKQQADQEQASDIYQALLRTVAQEGPPDQLGEGMRLAEQLKSEFPSSTYAQFAGLQLAAMAVQSGDLAVAASELRWVLGKAANGSDTALIAQLRLARVLASQGDTDQALGILAQDAQGYSASYAAARGDIFLGAGRTDEARDAYEQAMMLSSADGARANLPALGQKLQSLSPVPPRVLEEQVEVDEQSVDVIDTGIIVDGGE